MTESSYAHTSETGSVIEVCHENSEHVAKHLSLQTNLVTPHMGGNIPVGIAAGIANDVDIVSSAKNIPLLYDPGAGSSLQAELAFTGAAANTALLIESSIYSSSYWDWGQKMCF